MSGAPLRAAVLVTGDEVLGGRVQERTAAYLARDLAERGVAVERTVLVGDGRGIIADALRELLESGVRLICVTGGLGPTYDDLTMVSVADAVGRETSVVPGALDMVRRQSHGVRRQMQVDDQDLELMRRKQATLPDRATVLPPVGTAPGALLVEGRSIIVVLPGPPNEAIPMWQAAVDDPDLRALLAQAVPWPTRILRTWGVVEAELMTALVTLPSGILHGIGTYTRAGELEIVVPTDDAQAVESVLDEHFPGALFARDGELVEGLIAQALTARAERLAVAESCTGGGLGARLTALPGASAWFDGGIIAYSNDVKTRVLHVAREILAVHGAVSTECAAAMADGARTVSGAHWGVSITGIAGPDGGTDEKPVGTVCVGVAGPVATSFMTRFWTRDRESIRLRAQVAAMHALRLALTGR